MKWTAATIGIVVTVALTVSGVVGSYAVAQYQISELRDDVRELQEQRTEDRETIVEMRADVRWIRSTMERSGLKP